MIRHICVAVFLAIAGLTRPGPTSVKRILMPESSNFKAVLIPAADAVHLRAQKQVEPPLRCRPATVYRP